MLARDVFPVAEQMDANKYCLYCNKAARRIHLKTVKSILSTIYERGRDM